jgi:hypothetical protein
MLAVLGVVGAWASVRDRRRDRATHGADSGDEAEGSGCDAKNVDESGVRVGNSKWNGSDAVQQAYFGTYVTRLHGPADV